MGVAEAGERLAHDVADVVGDDRLGDRAGGADGDGFGGRIGVRAATSTSDGTPARLRRCRTVIGVEPVGVGVEHDQPGHQVGQRPDEAAHGLVAVAERRRRATRRCDSASAIAAASSSSSSTVTTSTAAGAASAAADERADAEDLGPAPRLGLVQARCRRPPAGR